MDADGSTHDEQAATAAATAAADDVSAGRSRQLVSVVDDVDDVPRSASSKTTPAADGRCHLASVPRSMTKHG